jgi:hypothetical protein
MTKKLKTEHSGAKNGGGLWGTRHEAKSLAKKLRRIRNKTLITLQSSTTPSITHHSCSLKKIRMGCEKRRINSLKSSRFFDV